MGKDQNELEKWFSANKNRLLNILKVEDGEQDIATVMLRDVEMVRHVDQDDYLAPLAILLHGEGIVKTSSDLEALPYDTYEIPLTNQLMAEFGEEKLQLNTGLRAYTIELGGMEDYQT
ncbi:MAG: hypothetical protein GX316_10490 [Firmicutes bacterium]|nr:hypothetical protein [Bacillota bacterium]